MYEIPNNLKQLYRHWVDHTQPLTATKGVSLNLDILKGIEPVIAERMRMWHRKMTGRTPYTHDPILSTYRFCNIYRELDRQTIEIHTALLDKRNDFELWLLNAAFQRFICRPSTTAKIGLLSFNEKSNRKVHDKLKNLSSPKYGTAYVFPISVIQRSMYPNREEFFCLYLPQIIKQVASFISKQKKASIVEMLPELLCIFGFNTKFHWTEILIDVAYQYPEYISLYKRFPIGPGSEPTMKKLNPTADSEDTALSLVNYQPNGFPYLTFNHKPILLSAENWEGIGCEFRKYTNLTNGHGRKRKFVNH